MGWRGLMSDLEGSGRVIEGGEGRGGEMNEGESV